MDGTRCAAAVPIVPYGARKEKSAVRARHDRMILATAPPDAIGPFYSGRTIVKLESASTRA